jgi:hypothetical protein
MEEETRMNQGAAGYVIAIALLVIAVFALGMFAYGESMEVKQRESLLRNSTLAELQAPPWKNDTATEMAKKTKALERKVESLETKVTGLEEKKEELEGLLEAKGLLATELATREKQLRGKLTERDEAEAKLSQKISELSERVAVAKSADEVDRLKEELEVEKLKRSKNNEAAKREQQMREQLKENHKDEISKYRSKIDQLQRALAEYQNLDARREEGRKELYDGKVLEVDVDRMVSVIDLGAVNRVSRGMRFDVIRWRQNRWDRVGSLEITKVFASTATAMIVNDVQQRMVCPLTGFVGAPGMRFSPYASSGENQDKVVSLINMGVEETASMKKHDPILKGDLITNPFYSRDRELNFTIAGEPSEYTHEELNTLVNKYGGKVLPKVTVETDYLVLCRVPEQGIADKKQILEETTAAKEMAKQYGIPVMREIELIQFLRH